jgi:hypothetical protein
MNRENYRTKRKSPPKRSSKVKGSKRNMATPAKQTNSYTQPKLREVYSAKAEWVQKVIPKLKE